MREGIAVVFAVLLLLASASVGKAEDPQAKIFQTSVKQEAKGKYKEALTSLETLTGERASDYMFHLRKGWLLYNLGRYGEAVKSYKKALSREPGSLEVRLGMLLPLMAARRWVDAEKLAMEALRLDPDNYLAGSRLAYTLYYMGKYKAAAARYSALVKRYPGDLEMRSGWAWALLKQGQHAKAKAQFQYVLRYSPEHSSAQQGIQLCP